MDIRTEHTLEIDADEYYDKIYFNEEFNAMLYKELGFKERTVLVQEDRGDTVYREVKQVPVRELPKILLKALGAAQLEYVEKGTYHKAKRLVEIEVVPSVKPDRINVKGRFWIEPVSPGRCRRIFELSVKASIFGIGGAIEKQIAEETRKSYDDSAEITARYIRENL